MQENKIKIISEEELNLQFQYIEKVKNLLRKRYGDRQYLAHVHSYGCQQNVSDGEKIKGMLALMGYGFCDLPEDAELVIYNTCAVRENAEDKVFGNVGELKNLKLMMNPDMVIGLCGCMMQQEHISNKIKKSYPFVDMVFGPHALHELPQILYKALTSKKRVYEVQDKAGIIAEGLPIARDSKFKAWLPIMYGCNNFCSYCVVPYVRGRERSRKSEDILTEFKQLINDGYKEITLLGQNVNSYGKGLDEDINFAKLLRMLNDVPGDFRIRFMSSHPKDATFELIDAMAECEKVCSHFHLPIQSGSDRILSLMNRNYTAKDYKKLVDYARKKIPDIAFTSDIIVGFPGETEEDFEKTLEMINYVRYDSLFSFIYSKRVGTKAEKMDDPTPASEKSKRFTRLLEAQRQIGTAHYQSCVGKTYRVLVDGAGRSGEEYLSGRSEGYMIIDFVGDKSLIGSFVNVKIVKSLGWALLGEIIN